MTHKITGTCLCAAVSIEVEGLKPSIGVCHCSTCRKWSGGPFIGVEAVSEIKFIGDENIIKYNSSDWAQRGFCKLCGTHLFYYLIPKQEYVLLAGMFEEQQGMIMDHQIFIDEKPSYYHFKEQTICKTGAEVFAEYSDSTEI